MPPIIMSLIQIDHNPSRRALAWFGLIWLGLFAAIAAAAFHRHGLTVSVAVLGGLAVLLPAAGWVWPPLMRIVYLTVAYATFPIGFTVLCLIMFATYYLVLTPLGIVLRVCRRDPLCRRFQPGAESYWVDRSEQPPPERYFHQF
jgi:hypothetical protein